MGFNGKQFVVPQADGIKVLAEKYSYVAMIRTEEFANTPLAGKKSVVSGTHLYALCAPFRICPRHGAVPFEEVAPFLPSLGINQPPLDSSLILEATEDGRHVAVAFSGLTYLYGMKLLRDRIEESNLIHGLVGGCGP